MSVKSAPYRLSWEQKAKDLTEVNDRLSTQLYNANQMIEILFAAVKDLTTRVEALE